MNLKGIYQMKRNQSERLHTIWFHLQDIPKRQNYTKNKSVTVMG